MAPRSFIVCMANLVGRNGSGCDSKRVVLSFNSMLSLFGLLSSSGEWDITCRCLLAIMARMIGYVHCWNLSSPN